MSPSSGTDCVLYKRSKWRVDVLPYSCFKWEFSSIWRCSYLFFIWWDFLSWVYLKNVLCIKVIGWFLFLIVNKVNYIDQFSKVKAAVLFWNKAHSSESRVYWVGVPCQKKFSVLGICSMLIRFSWSSYDGSVSALFLPSRPV